jgi:hypothetical protein
MDKSEEPSTIGRWLLNFMLTDSSDQFEKLKLFIRQMSLGSSQTLNFCFFYYGAGEHDRLETPCQKFAVAQMCLESVDRVWIVGTGCFGCDDLLANAMTETGLFCGVIKTRKP